MKKKNNCEFLNGIKIIVSPWEKGFSCGVIADDMHKMTNEQMELCQTIAKGMCYAANQDPHKIFMLGIKASRVEKKTKLTKGDGSNVIDFLEHLKKKRDEEQRANFKEEIQDPF